MDSITPIEHSDNIPYNSGIEKQSFEQVASIFDEEKGSVTIDKELDEFNSIDNSTRESIDSNIEEKIGIDLDDLGEDENSGSAFEQFEDEEEEEEEAVQEIEDYFSSAEFVIFITELIMVWGTNVYLQRNDLDKISIKEFNKTATEQKFLRQAWAKVLMKHNTKISAEMELVFALGSTYGMKLKGIVAEQKLRKREQEILIKEAQLKEKKKKPTIRVVKNDSDNDITDFEEVEEKEIDKEVVKAVKDVLEKNGKKKEKITKENFRLEKDKVIEEVKEESTGVSNLITVEK